MDRIKRIARRIFTLPPGCSVFVAICGFGLLIFAFSHDMPPVIDHLAYHLSTYALIVTITTLVRNFRWIKRWVSNVGWLKGLKKSPLGQLILRDPAFRARVGLFLTIAWNVVCALVKLLTGMVLGSTWLRCLGVYYLLLAWLRLTLAGPGFGSAADGGREWQRYRVCGISLLLMNLALLAMVLHFLRQEGSFQYPGPLIYLMAAYAFWALINATVKLVVYHRRSDPLMSAAKAISLTAAMVSILALETALIERFGDGGPFHQIMISITGGVVCMVELYIAIYMMRRGSRMIAAAGANDIIQMKEE